MVGEYYGEGALSVRFYDAVTSIDSSINGDIDFYAELLGSAPGQVLEIGCGTGRVALRSRQEATSSSVSTSQSRCSSWRVPSREIWSTPT